MDEHQCKGTGLIKEVYCGQAMNGCLSDSRTVNSFDGQLVYWGPLVAVLFGGGACLGLSSCLDKPLASGQVTGAKRLRSVDDGGHDVWAGAISRAEHA